MKLNETPLMKTVVKSRTWKLNSSRVDSYYVSLFDYFIQHWMKVLHLLLLLILLLEDADEVTEPMHRYTSIHASIIWCACDQRHIIHREYPPNNKYTCTNSPARLFTYMHTHRLVFCQCWLCFCHLFLSFDVWLLHTHHWRADVPTGTVWSQW